jgi:hypothetical protein
MAPFTPGRVCGAIVVSFGPKREYLANTNALVAGFFHIGFFRAK